MTFVCLLIGLKAPAATVGRGSHRDAISIVRPRKFSFGRFQSRFVSKMIWTLKCHTADGVTKQLFAQSWQRCYKSNNIMRLPCGSDFHRGSIVLEDTGQGE